MYRNCKNLNTLYIIQNTNTNIIKNLKRGVKQ